MKQNTPALPIEGGNILRSSAEFAKEAMKNQSLDNNEMLNIR